MKLKRLSDKKRAEILLKACKIARRDCDMALNGEWDKSDEGFEDTRDMLTDAIDQAGGC